jgi:hypothetical protein
VTNLHATICYHTQHTAALLARRRSSSCLASESSQNDFHSLWLEQIRIKLYILQEKSPMKQPWIARCKAWSRISVVTLWCNPCWKLRISLAQFSISRCPCPRHSAFRGKLLIRGKEYLAINPTRLINEDEWTNLLTELSCQVTVNYWEFWNFMKRQPNISSDGLRCRM